MRSSERLEEMRSAAYSKTKAPSLIGTSVRTHLPRDTRTRTAGGVSRAGDGRSYADRPTA